MYPCQHTMNTLCVIQCGGGGGGGIYVRVVRYSSMQIQLYLHSVHSYICCPLPVWCTPAHCIQCIYCICPSCVPKYAHTLPQLAQISVGLHKKCLQVKLYSIHRTSSTSLQLALHIPVLCDTSNIILMPLISLHLV